MDQNSGEPGAFGVLLRGHRLAAGLSMEELAERAGLSRRGISDLERGQRRAPYPSTVRRLTNALGLQEPERFGLFAAARPEKARVGSAEAGPDQVSIRRLPVPISSFIGREHEVAEIRARLSDSRLLTLVGSGGIGKTRLAYEVIQAGIRPSSHDVALVELASLSDSSLVPQAVAAALGVREQPHRSLVDTLIHVLQGRKLVLVLDNCEHLVQACAVLADRLLAACPGLRILATSREPLGISGEVIWRVPPLSPPAVGATLEGANLQESDAARLFIARAQAADRDFMPDARNVDAIAEVCRRLDGIPLALELAAARVDVLGVQQLTRRLDDRFRLLTTGSRTAHARQQTLWATLEWSYHLLAEPERRLFERLAVFAGGWTIHAIENVCVGHGLDAGQVLDTLSQLASKSLVITERTPDGTTRYRFLETVRHYAGERLRAQAQVEALRQDHANFFLTFAEQAAPRAFDGDPSLDALEQEHDNLRVALRWFIDRQETDKAQRLGAAIGRLWFYRGYLSEGRAWVAQLLRMPARNEPTPARAELLYRVGMLAWVQGDAVAARAPLEEALAVAEQLGDAQLEAQGLLGLGHLARNAGEHATARDWYRRSVAVARRAGLGRHETIALLGLGWVAHDTGDSTTARETLDEVLAIATDKGWSTLALQALVILGDLRRQNGDYGAARFQTQQALAMARLVGAKWWIASASLAQAHVFAWQGDHARAGELAREGLAQAYELGDQPGTARGLEVLALLAIENNQADHGLRLAGAAARLRASVGPPLAPPDRERVERSVATARRALGPRSQRPPGQTGVRCRSRTLWRARSKCHSFPSNAREHQGIA